MRGLRMCVVVVAALGAISAAAAQSAIDKVTPGATALVATLNSLDVEHHWIAGTRVNWETGLPRADGETLPGRHTHCSAFVASAAEKLGVYILRPPQHPQELLANAQNEWLASEGRAEGWRPLAGPAEAQAAANHGDLVVASYHNHHDDKPGHIAIVRPGERTAGQIAAEGPDVIQAGTVNSDSIPIKLGFAGHVHAWNDNEIDYYAHAVTPPAK